NFKFGSILYTPTAFAIWKASCYGNFIAIDLIVFNILIPIKVHREFNGFLFISRQTHYADILVERGKVFTLIMDSIRIKTGYSFCVRDIQPALIVCGLALMEEQKIHKA